MDKTLSPMLSVWGDRRRLEHQWLLGGGARRAPVQNWQRRARRDAKWEEGVFLRAGGLEREIKPKEKNNVAHCERTYDSTSVGA